MNIVYRAKHNNCHADALSQQPVFYPPLEDDGAKKVQVALISSHETDDADITALLHLCF